MRTEPLSPVVLAALAAVMRDVHADGVGLRLQAPAGPGESVTGAADIPVWDDEQPDVWLVQTDGSASGAFVDRTISDAESAAHVADIVHDAAIDELWGQGRDTGWPPCPDHPGAHPLAVAQGDPDPTWVCPR